MVRLVIVVVIGLVGMTSGGPQTDQDKVQGKWKVVEAVDNGTVVPQEYVQKMDATIEGDKLRFEHPEVEAAESVFNLDPSKKPKAILVAPKTGAQKGKKLHGIYELDGDTLRICTPTRESVRLTEFNSPRGSGNVLLVLKRARQ